MAPNTALEDEPDDPRDLFDGHLHFRGEGVACLLREELLVDAEALEEVINNSSKVPATVLRRYNCHLITEAVIILIPLKKRAILTRGSFS